MHQIPHHRQRIIRLGGSRTMLPRVAVALGRAARGQQFFQVRIAAVAVSATLAIFLKRAQIYL